VVDGPILTRSTVYGALAGAVSARRHRLPGRPSLGGRPIWLGVALAAVIVVAVFPIAGTRLASQPSFPTMVVSLVICFDLLCAVLLVRQFRDTGDRRSLAMSWAYIFSLIVVAGYALVFPGIVGTRPPSWSIPSTAPWLWVVWHTSFPVLLGVALAPWRVAWEVAVPLRQRARLAWMSCFGFGLAALALVAGVILGDRHMPALIHGLDTSAMSRVAGPTMLVLVVLGAVFALFGVRRGGAERWAAVAATTALGDVILTLSSTYRYSLGWYVGRGMTVVSSAVVLVALLAEFSAVKRQLAREGERLKIQLARTHELEQLQNTLLTHLSDGVVMQDRFERIVAHNDAARELLDLSDEELGGGGLENLRERLLIIDDAPRAQELTPPQITLRTGVAQRHQILGIRTRTGERRWLSLSTAAAIGPDHTADYVVTSMSDVTAEHSAHLATTRWATERRRRIIDVLAGDAPGMVYQPILALDTGAMLGVEALARFPGSPPLGPDVWFADAAAEGLGTELELKAIRTAIAQFGSLPRGIYLSVNASPETVASPRLPDILAGAPGDRLVLELTEHAHVEDYDALCTVLTRLRQRGIRLAVDDAGAGFASLRHILNLRPDLIKLDIGLTRGMDADPARRALATALLGFGAEIGAMIIAEGIETEAELATLKALGIRYGQGYLLGKPSQLPIVTTPAGTLRSVRTPHTVR
jgi:PAS domain S-box-containing protein